MGNCCCCACTEGQRTNVATHRYPTEEHLPLSGPAHLVFGPNLDMSIPNTYRAPPAPMPYDVVIGCPITPPPPPAVARDKTSGGANEATDSDTIQESGGPEDSGVAGDSEARASRSPDRNESENRESENPESENQESENQATERNEVAEIESDGTKEPYAESSRQAEKAGVSMAEEEDACPICLDEYDTVNPKLPTRCEHHFHLACILAWMERSETCPVCDQEMAFDHPADL